MQTHYVFVDFDNTHLGNIGLLSKSTSKLRIKIFLGSHYVSIPLALARALQPLGKDAEYIQLDHARHNAIDFNIAFQLGELASQHPDAQFSILSNDPAFNEIISGLRAKGVDCTRFSDMESLFKHLSIPTPAVKEEPKSDKVVAIKEPWQR
ncbi:MAG TPA: PIN domain-containing protein [Methylophilaceae bacterium]|nr:PIN domain-containing protein [Methylophilaceae bacterium]HQR60257.1 PIN domain-containing protein [Methylophilaceae bacterium]